MKKEQWYNKLLNWIIYAHFGQKFPFCKHDHVDVRTAQPVTLQPKTGICKLCKKEVRAKIIWEETKR